MATAKETRAPQVGNVVNWFDGEGKALKATIRETNVTEYTGMKKNKDGTEEATYADNFCLLYVEDGQGGDWLAKSQQGTKPGQWDFAD